ncbi:MULTISPECIES: CU044_2847 family protein [Trichocoleus]|uniref:Trypsin-co-occurring domain-containing protein n=1 Tax=Trichocoleus desertorum GB2-A4 TaxID=2933944 RepID=A0ABV0JE66_9CYAN|nr:CU044_2847 family protein [Trichocoleus sp. FACHB-46]MBD1865146.1 hypothetical protein [Trichocoleus sp. FACHB-46]
MGQLTPITLEDGTTIYIEAIDRSSSTPDVVVPNPLVENDIKRGGGIVFETPAKKQTQTFQAIEHTIRAYTTYTLNAFKNVAIAEVSEVTLKFGVNISSEAGIPYIANAKGGCSMEITVKCEFPKKTD